MPHVLILPLQLPLMHVLLMLFHLHPVLLHQKIYLRLVGTEKSHLQPALFQLASDHTFLRRGIRRGVTSLTTGNAGRVGETASEK